MTPYSETAIAAALDAISFDDKGLVPAIAQDRGSGEVLMMAWMDRTAVIETLKTGFGHYYSRSRAKLWKKGETSGHTQALHEFRVDCDGDTVLMVVDQEGLACHTGRRNCFFSLVEPDGLTVTSEVEKDPSEIYGDK